MKKKNTLWIITILIVISSGFATGQDFTVSTNQSVVGGTWYLEVLVSNVSSSANRYANGQFSLQFGPTSGLDFTNAPTNGSSGWTNLTAQYGTATINTTNFGSGNTTFPKYVAINFFNVPQYSDCVDWGTVSNTVKVVRISLPISSAAQNSECTWEINPASTGVGVMTSTNMYIANNRSSSSTIGFEDILGGTPLPVELSTFTAKQDGGKVMLSWQTKTEVNNYGFEVERSLSTKGGEMGWKKLGFVEGSGNSNSPKDYNYVDKKLMGGSKFSYRLKQIDTDGKFEYSNVVEIEVKPTKFELYQNYPNPFNPSTTISFAVPKSGNVTLKIYNTLGEEVATLADGYMEAGIHTMNFNADQLSSGLYIYRLNSKEATFTKKMLFLK